MKQYLKAGRLGSPRGIKGEVRFDCWCDSVDFLEDVDTLYLDENGEKPLEVSLYRASIPSIIFRGYEDRTSAAALTGRTVYFNRSDITLEEGSFFNDDLIGLTVVDYKSGEFIGVLKQIDECATGFYYLIENGEKRYYVPFNANFIKELSLSVIKVELIDGLEI